MGYGSGILIDLLLVWFYSISGMSAKLGLSMSANRLKDIALKMSVLGGVS